MVIGIFKEKNFTQRNLEKLLLLKIAHAEPHSDRPKVTGVQKSDKFEWSGNARKALYTYILYTQKTYLNIILSYILRFMPF